MLTPEQRQELIRLIEQGEDISPEWARILFPPEKREYELVYHGKEREEDILANTLAVPLQPVRTFGGNGNGDSEWRNMLIFGDNLQVMKSLLEMKKSGKLCNADGTPGVRLACIDPPFATKQDFKGSQDQKAYQDKIAGARFLEFLRKRLIFLKELLSDKASIYVHLDWKKGHYVKVIMDEVFGEHKFRNEIIWCYSGPARKIEDFPDKHETILRYCPNNSTIFNADDITIPYSDSFLARRKYTEGESGIYGSRVDADDQRDIDKFEKGKVPEDWWIDIPTGGQISRNELTGYPTQKPEKLLQRIIKASSNPGDLVLDVFAGSGTTCAVAEKHGR